MTAANCNTRTVPTFEAIQEALAFLKSLSEQKSSPENSGKQDPATTGSDILKTIEAALKMCSDAKASSAHGEDGQPEEDDGEARREKHAARTADPDIDEEDEDSAGDGEDDDEEDDDEEDDDNPFAGEYYWCPGPEWKTIGLVAGGAALVGLGALLYKLFDD